MLEFLKNYYVFMVILMVFSYLVQKEEYKAYVQFFIGIFVVVLFLEPVLELLVSENPFYVNQIFDELNMQIEKYEVNLTEGETIFEHFFFEGEGE